MFFIFRCQCCSSLAAIAAAETGLLHLANVPKRDCYHPSNRRTCAPRWTARLRCTAITAFSTLCSAQYKLCAEETQKKRNTAQYLEHIFHSEKKRQITGLSGTERNTTKIDLTPDTGSETLKHTTFQFYFCPFS